MGRKVGHNAVQETAVSQVYELRMEVKAAYFVIKTNRAITLTLCVKCARSPKINVSILVL
jgi:hypothetical protein